MKMEWNKVKLSSVCYSMHQGINTVADAVEYTNEGVQIIQSKHITSGKLDLTDARFLSCKVYENYKTKYNPRKGDILFCNIGTIGKSILIEEDLDFLIAWNLFLLKLNSARINSAFLKFYLDYIVSNKYYDQFLTGGTVKFINKKNLGETPIPLPPLEEQQRIAAVLDKADRLRQLDRQLVAQYDQLTQSVYLEMFGDPAFNRREWPIAKFVEVGKLDRGKSKHRPRNAPELLGGAYPLIQTGDVANASCYIKKYTQTYSDIGLKQSKLWPVGTLCITIAANIAKTGILTFDACFPDSVVGFHPNERTRTEYVQWWLSFLQKVLEETAPMAAQKNINLDILRNLNIPVPPIDLQNRFASIVENIERQKAKAEESLQRSEAVFQALLQRAFKGELFEHTAVLKEELSA